MKSLQIWILALLCLSLNNLVLAQDKLTIKATIDSEKLQVSKKVSIRLPQGYNDNHSSDSKYPVLYFLDAGRADSHIYEEISALSSSGIMPKMIIVGIERDGKNRLKDFIPTENDDGEGGGADDFIAFIEHELVPYIDKNYRTEDFKILQGHSLGGLFSLYTFQAKPELFDVHFAFSPSLQYADTSMTDSIEKYISNNTIKQKYLYANMGNEATDIMNSTGITMVNRYKAINSLLDSVNGKPFRYKFEYFQDEPHHMTQFTGMRRALRDLFKDWFYSWNRFALGVNELKEHHKYLSKQFGYKVLPNPGEMYWGHLANISIFNNRKNALGFLKYDVELHPNSIETLENLAHFYKEDNETDSAISLLEKALTLVSKEDDKYKELSKKLKEFTLARQELGS